MVVIACRWKLMGHYVLNDPHEKDKFEFTWIGYIDYAVEMDLFIKEFS